MTTASRFRLAARMADIAPFHVMRILAQTRRMETEGRRIIHMEVGEPPFATPPAVAAAGQRALADGRTFYTPAMGLPALREAIAAYYRERFGVALSAARIAVTPGSSAGLQLALAMLCGHGDEVLLSDPGYPCNRHFVQLFGATPVSLPVDADAGFLPSLAQLDTAWTARTRVLLLASPSNPTGAVIEPTAMRAYAEFVAARGGVLIVDEIYQGLNHRDAPHSALAIRDDIVVVNSFSKYFCMTGWRIGWLVLPEALLEPADRLAQNMYLAAPTLAQHAAIVALGDQTRPLLEERRAQLGDKLDFVRAGLERAGLPVPLAPAGAFYLYADTSGLPMPASVFCQRLLDEKGVAVTPGMDFGSYLAEQHIRLACVAGEQDLRDALRAIGELLDTCR